MTDTKLTILAQTADLATVQRLERENAALKQQIGALAGGRRMLTSLRAITLSKENDAIREVLKIIKGQ